MPYDQSTRNRLARFVGDARALLTEEFARQMQNQYGLDPQSGEETPMERLGALDDSQRETARILRETLDYYLAGRPSNQKTRGEAFDRILREQAFTVLNRLCALRMSEARGLIPQSVGKHYGSEGFQLYKRLAGSALGETGKAYHCYLLSLMDELAVDLPVLFDRFSPEGRLFPREGALLKLLDLINDPELEPLWGEDETIGWIYQYFNTKEEREKMRAESRAPRNSRELAVRNQFFTPRYVVEFLTDNTLGRIWYEMTQGKTALADLCRYLVRRKHTFFLQDGEEPPGPYDPVRDPWGDPDLPGEMWVPPNPRADDINYIFEYALTVGGYDYARSHWSIECGDLANLKLKEYRETGKWNGSFEELRCCLFFEQRRYHHFGRGPEGEAAKAIQDLYRAVCERWNYEAEFVAYRALKDPREITMLDPACGSMHFGLYAFDLFEQIYAEAWDLEERLGEDTFERQPGAKPLHRTYDKRDAFVKDVPRLIIERNIHGVDIDPRAVQIAGLSLWLRAQKSWQAQGLKSGERPQIQKSNVVCAEPMPGDKQMLEEFLATLRGDRLEALMRKAWRVSPGQTVRTTPQMADALTKWVRTVWREMELAGEAGSLLRIEETLRGSIEAARKESEEKSPLLHVTEYSLDEPPKEGYFQVVSGEEQDFFDRAETLVLAALEEFARQTENGAGYRRLLFVQDSVQAFSFIDLCQKRYDAIVMNPPFGLVQPDVFSYLQEKYLDTYVDAYGSFVERGRSLLGERGLVGAITSRTFIGSKKLARWRNSLLDELVVLADLGANVMDDAMVRSAAYIVESRSDLAGAIVFFDCRSDTKKDLGLLQIRNSFVSGSWGEKTFVLDRGFADALPGKRLLYQASSTIAHIFNESEPVEPAVATVRKGLTTFDDFRYLRLFWEVDPLLIGEHKKWEWFAKGGEYSVFYADVHLLVNRERDGAELAETNRRVNGQIAQSRQASSFYYRAGVQYTSRSAIGFSGRLVPRGCVWSSNAPLVIPVRQISSMYFVGWLSSRFIRALIEMQSTADDFVPGSIKSLPWRPPGRETVDKVDSASRILVRQYHELERWRETDPLFCGLLLSPFKSLNDVANFRRDDTEEALKQIAIIQEEITRLVDQLYSVDSEEMGDAILERDVVRETPRTSIETRTPAVAILSYMVGILFGRWDLRFATGERKIMDLPDPEQPLPSYQPGLARESGLEDVAGVFSVRGCTPRGPGKGILSDDDADPDGLGPRLLGLLSLIWGPSAGNLEQELCHTLDVPSIQTYLREPAMFFADHLRQYSKSRRAAPIYWPLSTPSCSYTLWLYYHRLNDQTLYTCVNDFVEPKLKQVTADADRLRQKRDRSSTEERELERLADFERELQEFRSELLRVAEFWKPDLNDGVEITAAPLWRLFQYKPWQKRLKQTWQKLETGEYDWAHLAYSIWPDRVRKKCQVDKSLAIAHHLEGLYTGPVGGGQRQRKEGRVSGEEPEDGIDDA